MALPLHHKNDMPGRIVEHAHVRALLYKRQYCRYCKHPITSYLQVIVRLHVRNVVNLARVRAMKQLSVFTTLIYMDP